MRALVEASRAGKLHAEVALVLSNRAEAEGLHFAWDNSIPALILNPSRYPTREDYVADLLHYLEHYQVDLIALAGYLKKLPDELIELYAGRILNIHPSLLPKHGGKGMYGLKVHQAVLDTGESETGVTVHLVTNEYDEGPAFAQESVPVIAGDTPEVLAARVLEVEHRLYPEALERFIRGSA